MNDCLLLVDGTDFQIAKKYDKPYYSYNFKKSGFHYEVALCIKTGDICWWAGPYLPGIWNDDMIFNHGLAKNLEPGERCEADGIYPGSLLCLPNALELLRQTQISQKCTRG